MPEVSIDLQIGMNVLLLMQCMMFVIFDDVYNDNTLLFLQVSRLSSLLLSDVFDERLRYLVRVTTPYYGVSSFAWCRSSVEQRRHRRDRLHRERPTNQIST
jgi:hypothetical protein